MRTLTRGFLGLGLIAGLAGAVGHAHAASALNTGGSACVPFASAGYGDLDFLSTGRLQIKSSAATKDVVCTVMREFITPSGTLQFFMDGSNANGKHVSPQLLITDHAGTPIATIFPSGGANSFGNGNFRMTFNVPSSQLGILSYVSALVTLPGSKNGSILGFSTP